MTLTSYSASITLSLYWSHCCSLISVSMNLWGPIVLFNPIIITHSISDHSFPAFSSSSLNSSDSDWYSNSNSIVSLWISWHYWYLYSLIPPYSYFSHSPLCLLSSFVDVYSILQSICCGISIFLRNHPISEIYMNWSFCALFWGFLLLLWIVDYFSADYPFLQSADVPSQCKYSWSSICNH